MQTRRERILDAMERVMGPLPEICRTPGRSAPSVKLEDSSELDGVVRSHIRYEAEPGDWIPACLLVPNVDAPGSGFPAVVALHQTIRIGKHEPAGVGGSTDLHYGLELARRGFLVIAPDYPGFGEYECDVYGAGYASTTMKAIVNHVRAVDVLASRDDIADGCIGAIGHSLGGHNSLFLAAFDARISAVVSSCGFNAFAYYKHGDLTGWSSEKYMPRIASEFRRDPDRMPFDFPDVLEAVAPRPVFTNAPLSDDNFAVEGVRVCERRVRERCAQTGSVCDFTFVYPDAGHEFPATIRRQAYDFLEKRLAAATDDGPDVSRPTETR